MRAPPVGLCCGTLINATLVEFIEAAARQDFPTITVRPTAFLEAVEHGETEASLRRRLRDACIAVRQIDALTSALPGAAPPDYADEALRALLSRDTFFPPDKASCFRAAEALECPWVNVVHFNGKPTPIEQLAEAVGGLCREARPRGLGIAIEFVPNTGIPDITTTQAIFDACGETNCGITLDPWHLERSGGSVADVRALPRGAIAGMQLCDRIAPPPGTPYVPMTGRYLPGEGELPLFDLVEAALANSPGITIECEMFSAEFKALSTDAAAARTAAAIGVWQERYEAQVPG